MGSAGGRGHPDTTVEVADWPAIHLRDMHQESVGNCIHDILTFSGVDIYIQSKCIILTDRIGFRDFTGVAVVGERWDLVPVIDGAESEFWCLTIDAGRMPGFSFEKDLTGESGNVIKAFATPAWPATPVGGHVEKSILPGVEEPALGGVKAQRKIFSERKPDGRWNPVDWGDSPVDIIALVR